MSIRRRNIASPLLLCLMGLVVITESFAQDEGGSGTYLVELVVFRHLDQGRTTPEINRPQNKVLSDPATAVTFASAPSAARQLNGTASSIRNLQAYQLIAHLAWEQNAQNEAEAPLIDLNGMGLNPAAAIGTAKLYERRYLQLNVDIALPGSGAIINAAKRIRLNRYYYLDHPDFGVIALVTRTE